MYLRMSNFISFTIYFNDYLSQISTLSNVQYISECIKFKIAMLLVLDPDVFIKCCSSENLSNFVNKSINGIQN